MSSVFASAFAAAAGIFAPSVFTVPITASGGVSDLSDVIALRKLNLYGAIIGRAYYNGAIDLSEAIKVAK